MVRSRWFGVVRRHHLGGKFGGQGVYGPCMLVREASDFFGPLSCRESQVFRGLSGGLQSFNVVELANWWTSAPPPGEQGVVVCYLSCHTYM